MFFVQNNQVYLIYEWLVMNDELMAWKNEEKNHLAYNIYMGATLLAYIFYMEDILFFNYLHSYKLKKH